MRLLSILALAWLVSRGISANAPWLRSRFAQPLVICGQHSLPVFCAGIFLSFLGRLAMEEQAGWVVQAGVNAVGLTALVAVGALAAWYKLKGKVTRPGLPELPRTGSAGVI